ncbi:hypothetical protein D3C80_670740 [compost metagenome]
MSDKPEDKVVYVVKTAITQSRLQEIIKILNEHDLVDYMQDEDDPKPLLTLEEVVGNEELLTYLCEASINENEDMHEAWNADAFCDFADFRK